MTGPGPQAFLTPAERQVLADAVSLLSGRLPAHQPQQSYSAEGGSRLRGKHDCDMEKLGIG